MPHSRRTLFPEIEEDSPVVRSYNEIIKSLPDALSMLQENGSLMDFTHFFKVLVDGKYPVDNIAFRLFLETVRWFSLDTTSQMTYWDDTKTFWKVAYKIMGDKFILFMSGLKNLGQVVSGECQRGYSNPCESQINFAVPSTKIIRDYNTQNFPKQLKPGIITETLNSVGKKNVHSEKDYIISVDGKKLVSGVDDTGGDIDLFGHETHLTATDERLLHAEEMKRLQVVTSLIMPLRERPLDFQGGGGLENFDYLKCSRSKSTALFTIL